MTASPPTHGRSSLRPYLFAYDIACPRRARRVLRALRRWRIDGQLSVHETLLTPYQARDLSTELMELTDEKEDRLLACRLGRRGEAPCFQMSGFGAGLLGPLQCAKLPDHPADGWYLLPYDVSEPKRLQRVQRVARKRAAFLQRSVYLFHGGGGALRTLAHDLADELKREEDDLRFYRVSGPRELWFLRGARPEMAGGAGERRKPGILQRVLAWLGDEG